MSSQLRQPDVLVIGGGPAGSASATLLARQGWQVRLFERERFPREHVGESLLPASLPILDQLGVLPAVEQAGFTKKLGATMVWGTDSEPWSWYFSETNRTHPHSYQVWRPTFDKLLLDNARAAGVDVQEGRRVTDVDLSDPAKPSVRVASEESTATHMARFLVDASGQTGLIGPARNLRSYDSDFQNLAVYAYYDGADHLAVPDDGNIFIESYADGWIWVIPLAGGRSSVGAVVDSELGQRGIAEAGLEAFLDSQIAQAARVRDLLAAGARSDGPYVIRDWSYVSSEMAGENFVIAGDAACFVDPLFSSGVHLALSSGLLAAAYVTTALRRPEMIEPAGRVYGELYLQQYHHFRELARLFYAANRSVDSYFWEARQITDDEAASPREAFIRAVAGQPPQGYERVVLDRGDTPTAFAKGVQALESARAARAEAWAGALTRDPTAAAVLAACPQAASGAHVERKPVFEDGEFIWGEAIVTNNRPEGSPVSGLVSRVFTLAEGTHSVAAIIEALSDGAAPEQAARIAQATLSTLRILYIDGAIEGMTDALASP